MQEFSRKSILAPGRVTVPRVKDERQWALVLLDRTAFVSDLLAIGIICSSNGTPHRWHLLGGIKTNGRKYIKK
jgi:hypothetical protein